MYCYVTMRDLLTWPREMCKHLVRLGMIPILYDNDSKYPPLLEWYKSDDCPYEVRYLNRNDGCYGFWNRGELLNNDHHNGYCAVTDCDLDLSGVPDDFLQVAMRVYRRNTSVMKVGVSLEINDVPSNAVARHAMNQYENKCWNHPLPESEGGHYLAGIGATLCICHSSRANAEFYSAIRLARPYTARHLPYYLTREQIESDSEYKYYLARCHDIPVFSNYIRKELVKQCVRTALT